MSAFATARRALSEGRHLALPPVVEFFNPINEGPVQPKTAYAASPLIFHAVRRVRRSYLHIEMYSRGVAPRICKNRALSGALTGYLFYTTDIDAFILRFGAPENS